MPIGLQSAHTQHSSCQASLQPIPHPPLQAAVRTQSLPFGGIIAGGTQLQLPDSPRVTKIAAIMSMTTIAWDFMLKL